MLRPWKISLLRARLLAFCTLFLCLAGLDQARGAFANGDLIVSFQAASGTGVAKTVVANLGAGVLWRETAANKANVIDLGSLLASTYGANWYQRTDLFMSINAVRANGYTAPSPGVVNGDTRNTIYVGRMKTDGDLSTSAYTAYSTAASALDTIGTSMMGYNGVVAKALMTTDAAQIDKAENNTIEDFTIAGGQSVNFDVYPNADFSANFGTGSAFSLGSTAYEGALGLQRVARSTSTSGSFAGNVVLTNPDTSLAYAAGTGANLGMFAIRDTGQVDFYATVPEPSTYAMLAVAAAGLGAHVIRRRRK